jgi:hypothetical protein
LALPLHALSGEVATSRHPFREPASSALFRDESADLSDSNRPGSVEHLEGHIPAAIAEGRFRSVPGISQTLAHRIHEALHIDSLEDLEAAANDGRLAGVPGIGPRRSRAILEYLDTVLGDRRQRADSRAPAEPPPVATLLELDREYRDRADHGELPMVAPRRFNPSHRAWLPVWETERDGWRFTLLYSNSGRAHRLGKTQDWVIIVFERENERDQCTVVTEHRLRQQGLRVVRGREEECAEHYRHNQDIMRDELCAWARALATDDGDLH